MKSIFALFFLFGGMIAYCQTDSVFYRTESVNFWAEQNEHYLDKKESPLAKKARKNFEGHRVYEFNMAYVVKAKFVKYERQDTVVMQTSADTEKLYAKYAQLHFNIGNNHCHLAVYQSLALRQMEEYKNYLFIPFRDLTSGKETYGGGRYMDIQIPETDEITLNFNLAYNPYCAYTTGYFCPVPPVENTQNVEIRAGAQTPASFYEK